MRKKAAASSWWARAELQLINLSFTSQYGQKTPIPDRNSKNRTLVLICAQSAKYALHCAQYTKCLDWTPDEIIGKHNKYTVRKCYYLENKIPIQSQWPKPHFLPTRCSMQLQWNCVYVLCQYKKEFARLGSDKLNLKSEVNITSQVGRPYLRNENPICNASAGS